VDFAWISWKWRFHDFESFLVLVATHTHSWFTPSAKLEGFYFANSSLFGRALNAKVFRLFDRCVSTGDRYITVRIHRHHVDDEGALPGQRDRSRARAPLGRAIRATGPEQGRPDRCERAAGRARRPRGVVELRGGGNITEETQFTHTRTHTET